MRRFRPYKLRRIRRALSRVRPRPRAALAPTVFLLAGLAAVVAPATARAEDVPTPFDRIGSNVIDAFTGTNLLYFGGAALTTGTMAFSGADHGLRVFTQRHLVAPAFSDSAFYAGYIVPVVLAPGVYIMGLVAHDRVTTGAGSATLQALGVTIATTSVLKWATGRPFPTHGGDPKDPARLTHDEYAREFYPFNFKGDYAWPSGHTSATTSIAAALTGYYPEHLWVPLVGYPLALLIGAGMVTGDRHWASDLAAGALIGHAIGYSIGRNFRRSVREGNKPDAKRWDTLTVRPLAGATYGLSVGGDL